MKQLLTAWESQLKKTNESNFALKIFSFSSKNYVHCTLYSADSNIVIRTPSHLCPGQDS